MIIRECPSRPTHPEPFWIGVILTCLICNCLFELENTDKPFLVEDDYLHSDDYQGIKCPNCGEIVVVPTKFQIFMERTFPKRFSRSFRLTAS